MLPASRGRGKVPPSSRGKNPYPTRQNAGASSCKAIKKHGVTQARRQPSDPGPGNAGGRQGSSQGSATFLFCQQLHAVPTQTFPEPLGHFPAFFVKPRTLATKIAAWRTAANKETRHEPWESDQRGFGQRTWGLPQTTCPSSLAARAAALPPRSREANPRWEPVNAPLMGTYGLLCGWLSAIERSLRDPFTLH